MKENITRIIACVVIVIISTGQAKAQSLPAKPNESEVKKSLFKKYTTEDPSTKTKALSAGCDCCWPGPGYRCVAHGKGICCACLEAMSKEESSIYDAYQKQLDDYNAAQQAKQAAEQKKEEEQLHRKQEQQQQEAQRQQLLAQQQAELLQRKQELERKHQEQQEIRQQLIQQQQQTQSQTNQTMQNSIQQGANAINGLVDALAASDARKEQARLNQQQKEKAEREQQEYEEKQRQIAAEQERIRTEQNNKPTDNENISANKYQIPAGTYSNEDIIRLAQDRYDKGLAAQNQGNYSDAFAAYEVSAKFGHKAAQNNLGVAYYNGQGVQQSYTNAFEWFKKSAEQGNDIAQRNIGMMYENGQGVTKDLQQAKYWYKKSAERGNVDAQKAVQKLEGMAPVPTAQKMVMEDIIGTWSYEMTWPSAPNLSIVNGKMTFETAADGSISGRSVTSPNQRFSLNDGFTGGSMSNNKILFKMQTAIPEIIQEYELIIIDKHRIKGTVKNVRTKPIADRPESWDIPAQIELNR